LEGKDVYKGIINTCFKSAILKTHNTCSKIRTDSLHRIECKRTIEEIRQAGIAAKAANNKGETND
jgi:hypothetical protein